MASQAHSNGTSGAIAHPMRATYHVQLYVKWLSLPHPDIHIAELLTVVHTLHATPELEEEVAATITPEQKKRFTLFKVGIFDIHLTYNKLKEFKKNMEEIRGVLEVIKEDELADFDREDFKRMEKLARE